MAQEIRSKGLAGAWLKPAQWSNQDREIPRSEEHTSELQSLMRISYAVFCLKKKKKHNTQHRNTKPPKKKNQSKNQLLEESRHNDTYNRITLIYTDHINLNHKNLTTTPKHVKSQTQHHQTNKRKQIQR